AMASPRTSRRTACRLGRHALLEGLALLGDYLRNQCGQTGALFRQFHFVLERAGGEDVPAALLAREDLLAGCVETSHSNRLLAEVGGPPIRHREVNLSVG